MDRLEVGHSFEWHSQSYSLPYICFRIWRHSQRMDESDAQQGHWKGRTCKDSVDSRGRLRAND